VQERKLKVFNAVTSTPDRDMKDLKRAISLGMVVMIENIQETINPALEPLLNKLIVKKGSMKTIITTTLCYIWPLHFQGRTTPLKYA